MFRPRHSLLVLPLLALLISAIPSHAAIMVSDAQLSVLSAPGPIGPYQSKDGIGYACTSDNSSPVMKIKYWDPGYSPRGSMDGMNDETDPTDANAGSVSNDGLAHGYFNLDIWSNILTWYKGPYNGSHLAMYELRIRAYHNSGNGYAVGYGFGPILGYTWWKVPTP